MVILIGGGALHYPMISSRITDYDIIDKTKREYRGGMVYWHYEKDR